ncbi:MAG: HIT family protein [Clostridia bacterium]|nr:HIT family protein [Clostridia bacterium]
MDCIFCKIAKKELESNIVYENNNIIAFLDIDPISEGHILIIPKEHYLDIEELPKNIINEIIELSQKIVKSLKEIYKPNGYSIMQNGGEFNDISHFHLHIFPRYQNDGFGWTCEDKKFNVSKEISDKIKNALKNLRSK